MTAPAPAYDDVDVPGETLCDEASCSSPWRVALQDGSKWCRLHAAAAAKVLRATMTREQYERACTLCGDDVARPYPCGWRCDSCAPGASS